MRIINVVFIRGGVSYTVKCDLQHSAKQIGHSMVQREISSAMADIRDVEQLNNALIYIYLSEQLFIFLFKLRIEIRIIILH